jgi:hypothetical protein
MECIPYLVVAPASCKRWLGGSRHGLRVYWASEQPPRPYSQGRRASREHDVPSVRGQMRFVDETPHVHDRHSTKQGSRAQQIRSHGVLLQAG